VLFYRNAVSVGSSSAVNPAPAAVAAAVVNPAKSLHALSAEVDSFGERMDVVLLRLATARLVLSKPENPGSIVWDYFSRVRGMPYRGRNVVCLPALALLARAAFCLSLHSNSNAPNPTTGAHLQDVPGLVEGARPHSFAPFGLCLSTPDFAGRKPLECLSSLLRDHSTEPL
jgi:hypothetical protein